MYFGQGFLFGEGLLARLILVLVVGISFYYWVYAVSRYKLPLPLRLLSILLIIWTLYGIPPIVMGSKAIVSVGRETFYYLKSIYISVLPVFAFYVFARERWLTEDILKKWFVVFFVVAIGDYYYGLQTSLNKMSELGHNVTEATNNAGYMMATLLCLAPLFYKKPGIQYVIIGACLLFTLGSLKRGAILCSVLSATAIILLSLKSNRDVLSPKRGNKKTVQIVFFTALLIIVGYYAVNSYLSSSDYFVYRLQETLEGNSSERDDIYSTILNHFLFNSDIISFLFGNGAYGTVEIFNTFAHNDWLEIAIDNGFFVLILYAVYWMSYINIIKKANKSSTCTIMLIVFVIIYFFRSFFSMSYSDITPFASCALGFSLANYQFKNRLE